MEQFIVFVNNYQNFALDISKIERIIEFQKPKRIPESSDYILGVIQYNEKILPIIDLTKRLYNEQSSHSTEGKIIVILWRDKHIGLVVDDILGIHNLNEEQYEKSNNDSQISKKYIRGFIKTEKDITIVLDTDEIFNLEQEQELLQAATR